MSRITLIVFLVLVSIMVIILIESIVTVLSEPPSKCTVYLGNWQDYTQDIPCGEVHAWCDRNGCEKSSGNCGKPICFCENITLGKDVM